jgi:hypothetical protein
MKLNDSLLVRAPTGAAAFNIHGSTLHHLLGINVGRPEPEDTLSKTTKKNIKSRMTNLLFLMIDERSMLSSNILTAADKNARECVFN